MNYLIIKKLSILATLVLIFNISVLAQKANSDENKGITYTIRSGKKEVWTPSSNPANKLSGSKEKTPSIKAENIIIEPGATLIISDMIIKMSPKGRIDVHCGKSPNKYGKLVMNRTVISSRLRLSPWGGIRVSGYFPNEVDSVRLRQKGIVTIDSCFMENAETPLAYFSLSK